jgi:hypothetical protein
MPFGVFLIIWSSERLPYSSIACNFMSVGQLCGLKQLLIFADCCVPL